MTAVKPMNGLRRRPMSGMPAERAEDNSSPTPPGASTALAGDALPEARDVDLASEGSAEPGSGARRRRPSEDYSATRLVNFRIPVDLHDRYRRLVLEVEQRYPRLRRPSLTEVLIGLLEEGPVDVEEVAEVIRRKRVNEYTEDPS